MSDSTLLLVVTLPFLGLWLAALIEVVRRGDLRPGRRTAWIAALLLVAPLALAAYVIARPPAAPRRSRGGEDASECERFVLLAEQRQRAELSDDEFRDAAAALVADARGRRSG